MIAGRKDALAVLGMAAGAGAALPLAAGSTTIAVPALAASAAGAGWLTWKNGIRRRDPVSRNKGREGFVLPSDPINPLTFGHGGYRVGITSDDHRPVDLSDNHAMRHMAIIGQSGVGKTVLGEQMLWQQTARAGGWMFVDAKLDYETRNHLGFMAMAMGRKHEFYVLDAGDPSRSNTYNPLLRGTGDEVASRLMSLLPVAENSPGADHYRQAANHALSVIVSALKSAHMAYHFGDLALLLQSPKALADLERRAANHPKADPEAIQGLQVFLDQYRKRGKEGDVQIDLKKLKETLGGMAGRIATFAQGEFGSMMNHHNPELDLFDAIANNKMVYVMLPTMAKGTAALNLGKMIVSDLRSAVARVQGLPGWRRPDPPFLAFLDEMGSYVLYDVKTLFEQARSARICMIPGFQALANLAVVTEDFAEIIIQNTWSKAFFKFGSADAEAAAEIIGNAMRFSEHLSETATESASSPLIRTTPEQQLSGGVSKGSTFRAAEEFRVTPDQLRALEVGQCCFTSGPRLYHLKVPRIEYPEDVPDYKPIRRDPAIGRNLTPAPYAAKYRDFLSIRESEVAEEDRKQAQHDMDKETKAVQDRLRQNNEADAT